MSVLFQFADNLRGGETDTSVHRLQDGNQKFVTKVEAERENEQKHNQLAKNNIEHMFMQWTDNRFTTAVRQR